MPVPGAVRADTTRTAAFGATACKALYRCETCREPFEYVKEILMAGPGTVAAEFHPLSGSRASTR